jgi:hypothetical protein
MKYVPTEACPNCGEEFTVDKIYHDNLGWFVVCPSCEGSHDVNAQYLVRNNQEDISYERAIHLLGVCMEFLAEGAQEFSEIYNEFANFGFTDEEMKALGYEYLFHSYN